jgi:hypothetical protein
MGKSGPATERSLYAWEIQEARRVFCNQLKYDPIRIHENVDWPNFINRMGSFLNHIPYTGVANAITLGNHLYFPEKLLETPAPVDHPDYFKMGWLIHELTHAWQYQRLGWSYLSMALQTQLRSGPSAYDFGGEEGLFQRFTQGWKLSNFNLEQQGDICRTYYECLARGKDTSVWLPFITEVQQNLEKV